MRGIQSIIAVASILCAIVGARAADVDPDLAEARQTIADLDWKQTLRLYPSIRDSAKPGSEQWLEATYCLAVAWHHVQPPDSTTIGTARQMYEEVIQQAPTSRWAARSMMNLGRIEELRDYLDDKIDLDAARKHYDRVVEAFANDPIAGEATLRAAATLVMAYDAPDYVKVKQGIARLEAWIASHPNEPLASVMWQYAGDADFRPLDDYKNALRCYEEVDKLGWVDKGNQGPWYWRCAQLAERELKLPDVAAKYYTKIIVETPNSGKAYESIQALKRLNKPIPASPMFDISTPVEPSSTQAPSTQRSNP